MIIDSHQHFWNYNPVKDGWITNAMEVIRNDFLPKDLKPILEANKVDGCVAVQADQSEDETRFLLQCAEENPFIKGVVGWVDLCAHNSEERLGFFSQNKNLKGIRHIVQSEPDDFMLRTDFQNGIRNLKQFGLTYDLLVSPNQLSATIQLVRKFPSQLFILNHVAKPDIENGKIEVWAEKIIELSKNENVFCKVSGLVTEANWTLWTPRDFRPYLDVIFKSFGAHRIVFGSDWPVCLLAANYREVRNILENYMAPFSEKQKRKVMGENAMNAYNL